MASDAAKQEFSRIELTKAAFDLSDRGVDGRAQPGPVDAFLYTERGVYRPGETVQLMAMLRDDGATALGSMPVTLIVKRPDGSEFTRFTHALQASGALHQAIALPKSSRRGRWSVAAHIDPKAAPVGRIEFSVEDFVPEKLKVELTSDEAILRPGQTNGFAVSADFLYGAPASDLSVEVDMRVTVDDQPFPAFAKYRFGPESDREKFEPPFITLKAPDTDEAGKSRLEWGGDQVKDTVLPLRAQLQARVFEPGGGRATQDRQDRADAQPRRLYRHPPRLRGPLLARGHRHRVRRRGGRRRGHADRAARASSTGSSASTTPINGTRSTDAGAGSRSPPSGW